MAARARTQRPPFEVGATSVPAGTRTTVDLPVSMLSDHTPVTMSMHVIHGRKPGPVMFVSAAVHGDEVIGVEIVRRLLRSPALDRISGTLLVVPIVNTFGFLNQSRYLPDRRDLNRSFPGSPGGSLAARLALLFMTEIVERADCGVDLHSAAVQRTNLPQCRVSTGDERALAMAKAFGAPVILTSRERDGSLRAASRERGVTTIVYEAGEGLRFEETGVRAGVAGILRVMHAQGMISTRGVPRTRTAPFVCHSSRWERAPAGGLFRAFQKRGAHVEEGALLGVVSDPFGEVERPVTASQSGIIVGRANLPVVNEGDALFHIARIPATVDGEAWAEAVSEQLEGDPLFDEDEII
ncbi:MAG: succinylglutamate desuccinylase/aspartoacylase family protein [Maritimibacter sp.]|nr:succinylglutamate desuccinylase/aspartoacylase family protein [Maritimibacter sp.]